MNFDTRKIVIIIFILSIGFIYAIRLLYMQVIDDTWTLRAAEIAERRKEITPPRAVIFDRNGKKIVSNRTYYNLMMVEADIEELDTVAFAKLVKMTPLEVRNRFIEIREGEGYYKNPNTGKTTSNYQKIRAYPFLKELTLEEIAEIAPHLDRFPGFYEDVTSMRKYPFANAANILGYLSEVYREDIEKDRYYRPADNIGRAGLERFYERELRGQKGVRYVVTSALNNAIESFADGKYDTIARQGDPLRLGLDITLQAYGEDLMQNKKGCIVAIEPTTGEILTMVSAPSFDPNLLVGKRNIGINYPKLVRDENKPLFPRPLQAEYPPGSIFKLVQSLIALQEGVIDVNTGFACNKSLVGCHNHPYPSDVMKAVQFSCNPYYYQATKRIIQQGKKKSIFADAEVGLNLWAKYMHSFGLGHRLESDITGQRPGRIPNADYYDKWYGHHQWAFSTIRSISIGQGEVALTPLQMANVAAIIANRGWYYTPHFVREIGDSGPLKEYTTKNYTMVDAKYFEPVVEGMRRVVNEAGGTAGRARLKEITVCGKTGTVQNPHGADHSVFIAFAPKDNPKIAIAVFVENAGFGGTWAAPIASLMIEKYLTGEISDEYKEKRILEAKLSNIK
ncbi:MAG: penicillin-binding transpeptidase domain-containing protein [Crocinitomicaceae bacterium]|jgi:penicillin-binding protein 2|nr:penicillin-binding transpeptidase domain-containing protein [Crocinitomicaceae bacterium]